MALLDRTHVSDVTKAIKEGLQDEEGRVGLADLHHVESANVKSVAVVVNAVLGSILEDESVVCGPASLAEGSTAPDLAEGLGMVLVIEAARLFLYSLAGAAVLGEDEGKHARSIEAAFARVRGSEGLVGGAEALAQRGNVIDAGLGGT